MGEPVGAVSVLNKRLSQNDYDDGGISPDKASWYWLTRSEVKWSAKTGPRPYLRLSQEDRGVLTLYPRTTLKGDLPSGKHVPDQPYPRGVRHQAHRHGRPRCRLNADATVLAYAPRPVGAYVLRRIARDCEEQNRDWLSTFRKALSELAESGGSTGGRRC